MKTRTINCMKTKHQILLVATTVAAFALDACVSSPHPGDAALASSPRFIEVYQELLGTPETIDESEAKWARSREHLAKLAENRALATSPRFLEVHPELLFAPISEGRFQPW